MGTQVEEAAIPEDMKEIAEEYRTSMIEAVAELDEELMEKYLEGEEISEEEINAAIRKGVIANEIVPVICGSSYKNKGVQQMLDAVVDYIPSPLDIPPIKGVTLEGEEADKTYCR